MQDSVVRNNLIYGNGIKGGAGGIHLTDEIGCGKASHRNLIVNNTILEPKIAGIRITDDAADNIIFNNIVYAPNRPRIPDEVEKSHIDMDSNLTLTTIPEGLFKNPSAHDYHLVDKSKAIDAGKAAYREKPAPDMDFEGTKRPQGKGVDLGAYEYKGM
jgi:parallel beta-helix repeat protein